MVNGSRYTQQYNDINQGTDMIITSGALNLRSEQTELIDSKRKGHLRTQLVDETHPSELVLDTQGSGVDENLAAIINNGRSSQASKPRRELVNINEQALKHIVQKKNTS